jgi:hypothetical protein
MTIANEGLAVLGVLKSCGAGRASVGVWVFGSWSVGEWRPGLVAVVAGFACG